MPEQPCSDAPRRVVITGIGCVTSLGLGAAAFWSNLSRGVCGISPTVYARDGLEATFPGAPVRGYSAEDHFNKDQLLQRDPFAQYAIVAAREAMSDAGLKPGDGDPSQTAVILGSGGGGEQSREEAAVRLFSQRKLRCHPMLVPRTNNQASVGWVSTEFCATGPSFVVSSGCAAATHAICQAFLVVRHGLARRAITGGSEASLTISAVQAFHAAKVLTQSVCRPFSRERDGMALSEGAGVVILEDLESARGRGAQIYAELAGVGMSADSSSSVHPNERGPAQALSAALADAGLAPHEVGYINAHGTGTVVNDQVESCAIKRAFGEHAYKLAVSSTKSMHGHALGGAGGIELVATLLAMRHGILPPTINHLGPDADCDLNYVPNQAREQKVGAALSQSFAFGGLNAVLALRKEPKLLQRNSVVLPSASEVFPR
jgi:nodulation protein E